jgi:Leucine-rich repeat (LRR) protein
MWLGLLVASARRQARAVEAIEASGGKVVYAHQFDFNAGYYRDGAPPGPDWLRQLVGRHYFDTVLDVSFSGFKQFDDAPDSLPLAAAIPYLADLPNLRHLTLSTLELTDDEFGALVAHANPQEMICVGMTVSDGAAARLTEAARLRHLGLNDVIISAKGVAEFKRLPNLEQFWLSCRHQEYAPSGRALWNREKYALRDEAVHAFIEFPKLRRLFLSWTQITDDGVKSLSRLTHLESFEISSPHITDAAMEYIVKFKNARWLSLGGTKIGDRSISRLAELKNLKGLRLSSAVTNDALPIVAQLRQLETLDLSGDRIDDAGLVHLAGMTNLRLLDLQTTAVTTDGPAVKKLQQALPNCKIRQYYPSPSWR